MERCPVCRARFRGESRCRRCHADLETIERISSQADRLTACAVQAASRGAFEQAHSLALRATALRSTPFGRCVAGFVSTVLDREGR